MARSPGGRSAGRVSIRVVPDSTLFRPDLLKTLQRLEITTRFNVRVLPDTTAFRASMRALAASTGGVRVNLDTTRAAAQFVASWRALQTYATRNPIQVRLNVDQSSLSALAASRTVPVRLATAQALADFRGLWAAMTAYARANPIPVRLDVDRDAFEAQLRTLLQDRTMNVRANVRGNALPLINRLAALPRNLFSGLAGGLGSVARFAAVSSVALAGVSAALAATAQISGGLVLALGEVAGVLALLPALALGGVAVLGTLGLAFTGLADATGNAGQVRDVVKGLADEFKGLRADVQGRFFFDLARPIQQLADEYIPVLSNRIGALAGQMNSAARGIINVLLQRQSVNDTAIGIANTTLLFQGLAAAAPSLTSALRDIAVVGSGFFPSFGDAIADASQRFSAFIALARADGSLDGFISNSLGAVASLGRTIGNVGSAFSSIFGAANANGYTFLQTLESVTGAFADIVASPQAQAGLNAFFTGAQAGIDAFLGALGSTLPGVLAAIGPLLGSLTQTVGEVLGSAVSAIAPVVAILAPAFQALADAVGPALIGFFAALAPSLQAVAGAMVPVFDALATSLPPLLAALAPVLAELATSAAGVFAQLATGLIPALADMFIALLPTIQELVPVLADLATQFIEQLLPVLPQITDAIIQGTPHFIQLVQLFAELTPVILAVTGVVFDLISKLLNFINTSPEVQRQLMGVKLAMDALIQFTRVLVTAITNFSTTASVVSSLVASAFGVMRDRVVSAFEAVRSGIAAKIGAAVDVVRGLPSQISSALGDLGSLLAQKGRDVIDGLINGIRSRISAISGVMSSVADRIAAFLPGSPVREGPLKVLNNGYAGGRIVEDILAPIRSSKSAVSGAMVALTSGPLTRASAAGGAGGAGLEVNFNGPVGWQPDEVARRINARQHDALAMAGLLGAV